MGKNLILCFDGTGNEPADGAQDSNWRGDVEDSSISNVLKLHLLFGGDFADQSRFHDQLSLYYSGIGTHGRKLKRAFNAAFAPENLDVSRILEEAMKDVKKHCQDGDRLFLFGFSRGAALSRKFASLLAKEFPANPPVVRFVGVFDTVASLGKPNLRDSELPVSDVVFENGTISPVIEEALHLLALDERRKAFRPTLMNKDPRVTEVWFPGAHSDIGGGFFRDGLSDVALRFMLDEIDGRNLGLRTLSPTKIHYDGLNAGDGETLLDLEDVIIEPNHFGQDHVQSRTPLMSRITLASRHVYVAERDEPTQDPPTLHHSVADRILGSTEYRPRNLRRLPHRVLHADGSEQSWAGLGAHLRLGSRLLKTLEVDESYRVPVFAHQKYNRSGILLERGAKYRFEIDEDQVWRDGGVECGPRGWNRDSVELGFREFAIRLRENNRRFPDADWFELVATLDDNDLMKFRVLDHTNRGNPYCPRASGEFCPFANDVMRDYSDNMGRVHVTVTRIE